MDRERLIRHLNERYCSKREMLTRIPLGVKPDAIWQELLNCRRSGSTGLPLYSCGGMPYWYMTTDKMINASEKIVEALFENDSDFDPYTEAPPVLTLEEVFFTSFVEGSQMTMQAAMEFLTGEQPPRDIEEQLIANNRMAGSYASGNLYRRIDSDILCELAAILTEGMDRGGGDFRTTDEVDFAAADGETFSFHTPTVICDSVNELCDFLSAQDVHPLIKAAVAQAYILVLRPFPEGNERLGRILSSMILLRAGYTFFSDVSLSALIARKGYAYYDAIVNILRVENGGDLTYFIEFFLELLSRAVDERRLRSQRQEEQARQAEMALARTVLSAADPVDPPQPLAKTAEPSAAPVIQETGSLIERSEPLDGFFSVSPTDHVPWTDEPKPVDDDASLGRLRGALYALAESGGALMKSSAVLLLSFLENGVDSFTVEDLQTNLSITPRQSGNLIPHLKERGVIESCEERVNRLMRYRFSKSLPLFAPTDYAPEIIQSIRELRASVRSPKDKRIGEVLENCISKGIVTAEDYAEIGQLEKLSSDMILPERMGIVTKIATGVYRINREAAASPLSLTVNQRKAMTQLYLNFGENTFTSDQAISVVNQSKATVCTYLHQFSLLRILESKGDTNYSYRLLMLPAEHPELYADVELETESSTEVSLNEQGEEVNMEKERRNDLYAKEVYEMIRTLSESSTSPRDRRLANVLTYCLDEGVIRQSNYERWGFTQSMWTSDMKLARQLGLAYKVSTGVYGMNKRLKPELQPHQKKTVSAIYETFGDQEFSSEMFIATLNYSLSHTYASLHKLTLLRILDQRSTDEGNRYQLLVSPEDHPECFELAA